jgi:uncharacterized protein YbjT (DUF2867 family)
MEAAPILVVGATGELGLEVCRQLRARGHRVRAFTRDGSPRRLELAGLGAEIATGDLKDARSIEKACLGARAVISTATCTTSRRSGDDLRSVDHDGQLSVIAAARKAAVGRLIYVSLSPGASPKSHFVRIKRAVEAAVRSSGLPWTILQPTAFMETWLSERLGWDLRRRRARILGDGRQRVSLISRGDVARYAVLAAEGLFPERDLPLGGPEALAGWDVVRICEEVAGGPFRVQRVPLGVLRVVAALLTPFRPIDASLIRLGLGSAESGDVVDTGALGPEVVPPVVTVRDYVRAAMSGP